VIILILFSEPSHFVGFQNLGEHLFKVSDVDTSS
jgi:hypothetical protein